MKFSLLAAILLMPLSVLPGADAPAAAKLGLANTPYQATGTRVGEMTDTTAVVWVRLTAKAERNGEGQRFDGLQGAASGTVKEVVDEFHGACPGLVGRVRLRYATNPELTDSITTDWFEVSEQTDFIHQFPLSNLKPNTIYYYSSEAAAVSEKSAPSSNARGSFRTAPTAETPTDITFCIMTCQGYKDRGHPDGHAIYPAMGKLHPAFAVLTGDLVYYDNDPPAAITARLARYHWERMFSLPRLKSFTASTGAYWLKDDHDVLANDSWPGKKAGELTFDEGQNIFRQQAPLGDSASYRTFRWGRDLQVWFTEGRDFRSPNSLPDGAHKTIWGSEQKAWFMKTVGESTARWKVLITPTPIVGPDRKNKSDNHSNDEFQNEGDEIRNWLKAHAPELVVVCGDRHWQYHSVHPKTGLNEFSVGPASDEHAGGSPGEDKAIHRFHCVKGGFLSVTVSPRETSSAIRFQLRDVDGEVRYTWNAP